MKKSAAAHLKVLSAMAADPIKAARAMLDTGKKHMKVTKKQISLNTIERLLKKQLGTEDVERMAMKVVKECGKRDVGFINFVMARRKQDAEKNVNKAPEFNHNIMGRFVIIIYTPTKCICLG